MTWGPSVGLRFFLGGSAAFGVIAAHCAAQFLMPHGAARPGEPRMTATHALDVATHRWGLGIALGLGILVALFLNVPLQRLWSTEARGTSHRPLFQHTAARLISFQVGGFLAMEAAEALLLRGQDAHFELGFALALGVVAQCLVATLAAVLLVLIAGTVGLFIRLGPIPEQATDTLMPRPVLAMIPSRFPVSRGGATLRGPPVTA
jgi:hypothetical protein